MQFIQVINRLAGIVAWVGIWNVLTILIPENDLIANTGLSISGMLMWYATDEFETRET